MNRRATGSCAQTQMLVRLCFVKTKFYGDREEGGGGGGVKKKRCIYEFTLSVTQGSQPSLLHWKVGSNEQSTFTSSLSSRFPRIWHIKAHRKHDFIMLTLFSSPSLSICQSWRCYCSRPIPLSTRNDSKQCAQRWRLQLLPPPILRETVVVFGIRSEGLVGSRMRKEEKWIKLRIQSRVRDERAGLDNPFVNR